MKQIVFLMSAFLMLFQIHSTVTAVPIDTSTGESVPESFSEVEKTESASNDVKGDKKEIGDAGVVYNEPPSQWGNIKRILLQLTDMVDTQMITYKSEIASVWRRKNVKPTTNWEPRTNEIKVRVQEIREEIVAFIKKLEGLEPIAWTVFEEAINNTVQNLVAFIKESRNAVVENASGTEKERAETVDEEFKDIMKAMNESWAKVQKIITDETMKASN